MRCNRSLCGFSGLVVTPDRGVAHFLLCLIRHSPWKAPELKGSGRIWAPVADDASKQLRWPYSNSATALEMSGHHRFGLVYKTSLSSGNRYGPDRDTHQMLAHRESSRVSVARTQLLRRHVGPIGDKRLVGRFGLHAWIENCEQRGWQPKIRTSITRPAKISSRLAHHVLRPHTVWLDLCWVL